MAKKLCLGLGLLAALALAAGGAASLLAQEGGDEADGLPDIGGAWTGTAKVVLYEMSTGGRKEKLKLPVTLAVTQAGADLTIDLTVTDPEEGTISFHLTGKIGNGHFWAATDGEGEEEGALVMTGHVKAKGKKIKGTGIAASDNEVDEIRFSLKKK